MKSAVAVLALLTNGLLWAQNTVVLSGKITDAATGLRVEDAAIALTQNGRAASRQMHYTDAGGNYSFEEVATGSGTVEIAAKGFLAFSVDITVDQAVHDFKLTPAASIAGRISGEGDGRPQGVTVAKLFREDFTDGVRHFAPVATVSTIQINGSFSFAGLEPGRYIIAAGPGEDRQIQMRIIGGKIVLQNPPTEGYVQTYYPGTTEFAAALLISLNAGETRNADFRVAKRPLFRASGEVSVDGGEQWKGALEVVASDDGLSRRIYSGSATIPGPFLIEGLPAGQYTATGIHGATESVPTGGSGFSFSMRIMPVNLTFTITDHDLEGLRIVRGAPLVPLAVNGTFRMANGGALPAGLSVQFAYPEPGGVSTPIPAAPGGEFWLNGAPGDYSIEPVIPPGYAATEVRYGGVNYKNSLIPMKGDSLDSSLTIVLSDQPASVTGSVIDGDQKPVAATISLTPDPLPAGLDFRAIRVAKTDSQGAFSINGLAPGRYKAVGLTGEDRKRDHDLAILSDKLRSAVAFEVIAGQTVSINLRQ